MALTVACFAWGNWPHKELYVQRLQSMVARHLTLPYRFVCFTDEPIEKVPIEYLPDSILKWRRKLPKMWLYAPENGLNGRVLAMYLDTVITGSLDEIAAYDGWFCVLDDFWDPGQLGGGLISFDADNPGLRWDLWDPLIDNYDEVVSETGGNERYWYRRQSGGADRWQWLFPGQMADAKPKGQDIIYEVPHGTRMVHFHGRPRPHEVDRDWITEHWR